MIPHTGGKPGGCPGRCGRPRPPPRPCSPSARPRTRSRAARASATVSPAAGGHGRGDHAVQRPAEPGRAQGGSRSRGGELRRGQARPQAPAPALRLAEILTEAGFPAGAVGVIPGGRDTGAALLADPRVDLISFTGGVAAGQQIRAAAGIRPVLLELGGNSANLVCPDADIDLALRECVTGGFSNNGQSCNSVQRVLVPRAQHDEFAALLAARAAGLRLGDPMDDQTDIGPLIAESSAIRVESAIAEAVAKGAVLHTGSTRRGAVIAPTVLSRVDRRLSLYCNEVFAPVVLVEASTAWTTPSKPPTAPRSRCRRPYSPARWTWPHAVSASFGRAASW